MWHEPACDRPWRAAMTSRGGAVLVGAVCGSLALSCASASHAGRPADAGPAIAAESREVSLPAGRVRMDVYLPREHGPRPLVVVAHGFWRSRKNMAGWGRHLAGRGFVVLAPTLPAWADHERNGRSLRELIDWALTHPPRPIDPRRIALVGFSAGGLASLLAAADDERVRLSIGLDPVDHGDKGAKAAGSLKSGALILLASPSGCNANGNASGIIRALGERATVISVPGATHTDPEWPTDWKARLACGKDSEDRRARFVEAATAALDAM